MHWLRLVLNKGDPDEMKAALERVETAVTSIDAMLSNSKAVRAPRPAQDTDSTESYDDGFEAGLKAALDEMEKSDATP